MDKIHKISCKVFLFERVKKKIRFFETDSYPVQIRLTAGKRSIYLKSNFFSQLCLPKYQQVLQPHKTISVTDVIYREQALLHFLLQQQGNVSLETMKQQYQYFSQDLLHLMDENFKQFLQAFFRDENLPAYSLLLQQADNYTSGFIMHSLEQSLQPLVLDKLWQNAVEKAPPYIPFLQFLRYSKPDSEIFFPVYEWQPAIAAAFEQFVMTHFPAYSDPVKYIDDLLKSSIPST